MINSPQTSILETHKEHSKLDWKPTIKYFQDELWLIVCTKNYQIAQCSIALVSNFLQLKDEFVNSEDIPESLRNQRMMNKKFQHVLWRDHYIPFYPLDKQEAEELSEFLFTMTDTVKYKIEMELEDFLKNPARTYRTSTQIQYNENLYTKIWIENKWSLFKSNELEQYLGF